MPAAGEAAGGQGAGPDRRLRRLEDGLRSASPWYWWGPYLSERQWGTVREDYSADGDAWDYLPHDHARSRAYRWGEDGLAGFCDIEQRLCLGARALERARPDPQGADLRADRRAGQPRRGRQGVLVVPRRAAQPRLEPLALPLPAGASSPTSDLVAENGAPRQLDPEYELLDTGVVRRRPLLGRRGATTRRPTRTDLLMTIARHQRRPRRRRRSTCCRPPGSATPGRGTSMPSSPSSRAGTAPALLHRAPVARPTWSCRRAPAPDGRARRCCSATTRPTPRASSARPRRTPYPKDGINDHVVARRRHGQPRRVRAPRRRSGTGSPWSRARRSSCSCACGRARRRRPRRGAARRRLRRASSAAPRPRPTSSTPSSRRPAARRTRPIVHAPGASPGCCGASSCTTTTSRRWLDGDPRSPPPPERRG